MKVIDLYSCSLFISSKNSVSIMEKLNGKTGKGIGLACEHSYRGYTQLKESLATTIELLSYSSKARDLISKEDWGEYILRNMSTDDNFISEFKKMKAKQTHDLYIESRPLKFLFLIFFSYNTLYTWEREKILLKKDKENSYNYTRLLKDFKKILITKSADKVTKTEIIEQDTNDLISDFCFYSILKSTIDVLESIKDESIEDISNGLEPNEDENLLELIEYMGDSLKYFHQDFMGWGEIVFSDDLETQFHTLRINNYDEGKKRYRDYLNLNLEMNKLSKEDIKLIDNVIEELFSFQLDDNLEESLRKESKKLDTSFEQRKNVDIKPLDFMKQTVKGNDKEKVLEIKNKFPLY